MSKLHDIFRKKEAKVLKKQEFWSLGDREFGQ